MASHPARHTVTGGSTDSAAHAARPPIPRRRLLALLAGAVGLLGALGLGIWAFLGSSGPSTSTPTSAQLITVTPAHHR